MQIRHVVWRWVWRMGLVLGLMQLGAVALGAAPASSSQPQALNLVSTIESIGVESPYSGDTNQNNQAELFYRSVGSTSWRSGSVMVRDTSSSSWYGTLVHLKPDTRYEVQVRYTDSDGVSPTQVTATARTRPDYPEIGANGTVHTFSPNDDWSALLDQAQPGDTIQLAAGTYHTSLVVDADQGGQPGQYLTIEAAPGANVILDGADPALNGPGDDWTFYTSTAAGDVYYADLPWSNESCSEENALPYYVGALSNAGHLRYLLFDSDDSWENDFLPALPGKAYFLCRDGNLGPAQRLFVLTHNGQDPDALEMHVSRYTEGVTLRGADYVRVRGLTFQHYGWAGLFVAATSNNGADHNIIEENTFLGNGRRHLRVSGLPNVPLSSHNLIQDNYFLEAGYRDTGWIWEVSYLKARTGVNVIYLQWAGEGNVIRRNVIDNAHDGIVINRSSSHVDVNENVVNHCMDDAVEIDNEPGRLIRVWDNRINYCYTGISLQDWNGADHGPAYIFRNLIVGGEDPEGRTDVEGDTGGYATYTAFKLGSDVRPDGYVFFYHNTIDLRRDTNRGDGLYNAGGVHFANAVSRNNIWYVTGRPFRFTTSQATINHDLDCDSMPDLRPGNPINRFVTWASNDYESLDEVQAQLNQQTNGISTLNTRLNSDLSLPPNSPEIDAGCVIPGFNDAGPRAFSGAAPDIGAIEYRIGTFLPSEFLFLPLILR